MAGEPDTPQLPDTNNEPTKADGTEQPVTVPAEPPATPPQAASVSATEPVAATAGDTPRQGLLLQLFSAESCWSRNFRAFERTFAFQFIALCLGVLTLVVTGATLLSLMEEFEARKRDRIDRAWDRILQPATGNTGKGAAITYLIEQGADLAGLDVSCKKMGGYEDGECVNPPIFTDLKLHSPGSDPSPTHDLPFIYLNPVSGGGWGSSGGTDGGGGGGYWWEVHSTDWEEEREPWTALDEVEGPRRTYVNPVVDLSYSDISAANIESSDYRIKFDGARIKRSSFDSAHIRASKTQIYFSTFFNSRIEIFEYSSIRASIIVEPHFVFYSSAGARSAKNNAFLAAAPPTCQYMFEAQSSSWTCHDDLFAQNAICDIHAGRSLEDGKVEKSALLYALQWSSNFCADLPPAGTFEKISLAEARRRYPEEWGMAPVETAPAAPAPE